MVSHETPWVAETGMPMVVVKSTPPDKSSSLNRHSVAALDSPSSGLFLGHIGCHPLYCRGWNWRKCPSSVVNSSYILSHKSSEGGSFWGVTSGLRFSQNRVSYIIPGAGNGGGALDFLPLYLRTTKNIATPAPASINTDPTTITAITQAGKSESELCFIVHSFMLFEMV